MKITKRRIAVFCSFLPALFYANTGWAVDARIQTRIEGQSYKNQVIYTNLLEAEKNKHVIFTYCPTNESGENWEKLLDTENVTSTAGSSMSLQLTKESVFSDFLKVRLRKNLGSSKLEVENDIYHYSPEGEEIIVIRSAHGGTGKPNWVKLNGMEVKKTDTWPTNNVYVFTVKKNDRLDFTSPGWKPSLFVFDEVNGTGQRSETFPLQGKAFPASFGRNNTIYLVGGEVGRVFFPIWSSERTKPSLNKPALIFEYPEKMLNIKIYDIAGRGYNLYQPVPCILSSFKKNGMKFTRCEIDLENYLERFYNYTKSTGLPMEMSYHYGHLFLIFEPSGTGEKEFPFFWHFKDESGNSSDAKELTIKVLPPLDNKLKPKHFGLLVWGGNDFGVSQDDDYIRRRAALYKKLNMRDVVGRIGNGKNLLHLGLNLISHQGIITSGYEGIMRDATTANVCFQKTIDNNSPMKEWLKRYNDEKDPIYKENFAGMEFDFEPKPADILSSCFCDRCREVFKERTGIDIKGLSPDDIISKYKNEWIDFRVRQYEQILSLVYKMTKEINPDWPLYLSSHYLLLDEEKNRAFINLTGQDMRRFVRHCDYLLPMIYKDPLYIYDHLLYNQNNLETNIVPTVHLNRSGSFDYPDIQTPEYIAIETVYTASMKVGKIALYAGNHLDGEYFKMLDTTLSSLANFEDFYFEGEDISENIKVSSPEETASISIEGRKLAIGKDPLTAIRIRTHKLGNKYLVSAFNLEESRHLTHINIIIPGLPGGNYVIENKMTGNFLEAARENTWTSENLTQDGLLLSLSPMSMKILEIRKQTNKDRISKTEPASTYSPASGMVNAEEQIRPLSLRNTTVRWIEIDGDESPEIEVITPSQKVIIGLDGGGRLRSWNPAQSASELLKIQPETELDVRYGTGACYDMFFIPKNARWAGDEKSSYDFENREIDKDGNALIALKRRLSFGPLNGLILQKEYLIYESVPKIEVSLQISEASDPPKDISFWVRNNTFIPGGKGNIAPAERYVLRAPLTNKTEVSGAGGTLFYLAPGLTSLMDFPDNAHGTLREGWIEWEDSLSKDRVRYSFELDKVHQLYLCLPYTVEWMYKVQAAGFGTRLKVKYSMIFLKGNAPAM